MERSPCADDDSVGQRSDPNRMMMREAMGIDGTPAAAPEPVMHPSDRLLLLRPSTTRDPGPCSQEKMGKTDERMDPRAPLTAAAVDGFVADCLAVPPAALAVALAAAAAPLLATGAADQRRFAVQRQSR